MSDKSVVSVLSIDAWADGDGWMGNQWWKVGECNLDDLPADDAGKLRWFVEHGFASNLALSEGEVEDDGYNFVLLDKKDRRPLFAIAYGDAD